MPNVYDELPPRNYNGYEKWRRTIEFTDEQIATALEAEADAVEKPWFREKYRRMAAHLRRTGRLTREAISEAIGRLVKTCFICGKPALYRIGCHGRCSLHRDVSTKWKLEEQRRYDTQWALIGTERSDRDARVLSKRNASGTRKYGSRS